MADYDYLVVGAGLFGATFAHQAKKQGKRCLVIDKRPHAGGNTYCKNEEGIHVHFYGAHIFHTNDKEIWEFVNSFVPFNNYRHSVIANYKGRLYDLPFNMHTFQQLWGVTTAEEAQKKIAEQIAGSNIHHPKNLEEQAISLVGTDIYDKLIKGYTEKQWGRSAKELPSFIIKRLPVRFSYDNSYFNDAYQGIPIGGYNKLTEGLLNSIEIKLNCDFFSDRTYFEELAEKIVYTGPLDEFYGFRFGELEYRSLRFEHQKMDKEYFQNNSVVNYTDAETPFTRIIEHKYFEGTKAAHTVITHEYPLEWKKGLEPYYPINDEKNMKRFRQYQQLSEKEANIIFGGRLAEYRYYDMHQVIAAALVKARREFEQL
ncbi:MAG: UDP-galactopyranose mutase [Chitinophagaceae bacterium]